MRTRHARFARALPVFVVVAARARERALAQNAPAPTPAPAPAPLPVAPRALARHGVRAHARRPVERLQRTGPTPRRPTAPSAAATRTESSARTRSPATRKTRSTTARAGTAGARCTATRTAPSSSAADRRAATSPYSHIVRRGDTLWGICGDTSRTRTSGRGSGRTTRRSRTRTGSTRATRSACATPRRPPAGAEQRDREGRRCPYRAADARRPPPAGARTAPCSCATRAGSTTRPTRSGATSPARPTDKMFLTDLDEVYLHLDTGHDVQLGQELTIFRPHHVGARPGRIVQILGTAAHRPVGRAGPRRARARSSSRSTSSSAARASAPWSASSTIVPPLRNDVDVQGARARERPPHEFFGQQPGRLHRQGRDGGPQAGQPRSSSSAAATPGGRRCSTATPAERVSPDDETPCRAWSRRPARARTRRTTPTR